MRRVVAQETLSAVCLLFGIQAAAHHRRLEELQEAAAAGARAGKAHEPRWFSRDPGAKIGEQYVFRYRGGYWEARAAGAFSGKK